MLYVRLTFLVVFSTFCAELTWGKGRGWKRSPQTPGSRPITGNGRILIIDNNPERANSLISILEASRYKVAVPVRLQEGVAEQVARIKPDIILIGVDFPGRAILSLGRVSP